MAYTKKQIAQWYATRLSQSPLAQWAFTFLAMALTKNSAVFEWMKSHSAEVKYATVVMLLCQSIQYLNRMQFKAHQCVQLMEKIETTNQVQATRANVLEWSVA